MTVDYAAGIQRLSFFFRMETDPIVRIWTGFGDYVLPADNIETETSNYIGWGDILQLPTLNQLVNGVASRVDFSISGVGETGLRLADEDYDQVRGAIVHIGMVPQDENWQPAGPTEWIWEGEADVLTFDSRNEGDRRVETIALSVGSIFTGRRRPRFKHYTDAEQRRRSADDRLCDRVTLYSQQYTKTWPRF